MAKVGRSAATAADEFGTLRAFGKAIPETAQPLGDSGRVSRTRRQPQCWLAGIAATIDRADDSRRAVTGFRRSARSPRSPTRGVVIRQRICHCVSVVRGEFSSRINGDAAIAVAIEQSRLAEVG